MGHMFLPKDEHFSHLIRQDQIHDPLYVVTVVFNPIRYRTRWKMYNDFALRANAAGARLLTVEVAFGNRDFVLQDSPSHMYVPIRSSHELWMKENAINVGFQHLPIDWKYAAWVDADVEFARADWVNETLHQLQHYHVVQMFSECADLSPDYEILTRHKGFIWCHLNGIPNTAIPKGSIKRDLRVTEASGWGGSSRCDTACTNENYPHGTYWHPGFGQAWRREAFDSVGGLIDFAILGGGDLYMNRALCGIDVEDRALPRSIGDTGKRWLKLWAERAELHIRRNVGYVPGLALHMWHGRKAERSYKDRGQILVQANFDAERDIYKDTQGLWQLRPDNIALRDGIREYLRSRNEDSITL